MEPLLEWGLIVVVFATMISLVHYARYHLKHARWEKMEKLVKMVVSQQEQLVNALVGVLDFSLAITVRLSKHL